MKKIVFFSVLTFVAVNLGFGLYPVAHGFIAKIPKLEIPAGQVYCRFVPSSQK